MEIQVAECCAGPQGCLLSECKPEIETHQKQKRPESVQIISVLAIKEERGEGHCLAHVGVKCRKLNVLVAVCNFFPN